MGTKLVRIPLPKLGQVLNGTGRRSADPNDFASGSWMPMGRGATYHVQRPYSQVEWVYGSIRVMTYAISDLPLVSVRGPRSNPELVEDSDLARLLALPDPTMGPEQWTLEVASWLLYQGQCFLIPKRLGQLAMPGEMPTSLEIVHQPSQVAPVVKDGALMAWRIPGLGEVDPARVIDIRFWNPDEPFRGLSGTEVAGLLLSSLYDATVFNASRMRNQGDVGGTIELEHEADPVSIKLLRQQFLEAQSGPWNAGMPLVLDQGKKWTPPSQSNRDMQHLELVQEGRDTITGPIYGVPKSILGVTDAMPLATALTQERGFYVWSVIPISTIITGRLAAWLRTSVGITEERPWFSTRDVEALQRNRTEQAQEAEALGRLGFTRNEINEAVYSGRLPDNSEWGDEAFVSSSMVTASALVAEMEALLEEPEPAPAAAPPPPPPPAGDEPEPEDDDTTGRAAVQARPAGPGRNGRRVLRLDRSRAFREEAAKAADEYWRAVVVPGQREMRSTAWRFLRSNARDTRTWLDEHTGKRQASGLTQADLDSLADLQAKWDREIQRAFEEPFADTQEMSAQRTARELGDEAFRFDAQDPKWLSARADRLAEMVQVNATTIDRIRSALLRGMADGDSVVELARRLQATAFRNSFSRALTISRTEAGKVASATRFTVMESHNVGKTEWVTAGDDVVRDLHMDVDGEQVSLGQAFSNGLKHPRDPDSDDPAQVINCRCNAVAVF